MAEEGTNGATEGTGNGDPKGATADTPKQTSEAVAKGPAAGTQTPFGELDTDTTEWLTKREVKDVPTLLKLARDKDKMVGEQASKLSTAIVRPGKDAKPEEIAAYREKIGAGNTPDDYVFELPKDLPEGLPYDGERAKSFAKLANDIELTKAQAQAVHDFAAANGVVDFNSAVGAEQERRVQVAKAETEKLTKLYGPVTGEQFRTNAAFADKALALGGEEALQALMADGFIAEVNGQKIVQNAHLFTLFAKVGSSLFREGELLRGDPTQLNNPFMDGESENFTDQGRIIQADRSRALSLIAAAGKTPADFGLKV